MYVALKDFYYRNRYYREGDTVPADKWPNREALVRIRRIKAAGASTVEPPPINIRELKRDQLNEYAMANGISDPTVYKTKEELVKALEEGVSAGSSDAGTTPETESSAPSTGTETEGSSAETGGEQTGVTEDDDLFADDSSEDDNSDVEVENPE